MAALYGSLTNEKQKTVTKMAQREITAHIRTWDFGIGVEIIRDSSGGALCRVYETGGSNDARETKLIKEYKLKSISTKRPGSEYRGQPIGNEVAR